MEAARELASKIARNGRLDDLNRQLDLLSRALPICQRTEDFQESVHGFMEKRPWLHEEASTGIQGEIDDLHQSVDQQPGRQLGIEIG